MVAFEKECVCAQWMRRQSMGNWVYFGTVDAIEHDTSICEEYILLCAGRQIRWAVTEEKGDICKSSSTGTSRVTRLKTDKRTNTWTLDRPKDRFIERLSDIPS